MIQFLLNQRLVSEHDIDPNTTVLNYLRQHQRRCGTKEGCASGDCGACTVTLGHVEAGQMRYQTVNSCLTFVSHLQGKQLISVEDLRQPAGLHSAQQAMVDCHASQCGFCTPGFVMSIFTLQKNGGGAEPRQIEQALAGNLCRCTGYRPIVDAARQACAAAGTDSFQQQEAATVAQLLQLQTPEMQELRWQGNRCLLPKTIKQLSEALLAHPGATLLAGGTDLALQVTQRGETLPLLIAVDQIAELKQCVIHDDERVIGAGVSLSACWQWLGEAIPALTQILARFASQQIRNLGTLGGNIGNASPIGDMPPMLLALDASLILQQGDQQRRLPLADFFLSYRKTALREGEFIRAVVIPHSATEEHFRAWKVSKRREDDISAVFAAFTLATDDSGCVSRVRIAFGGMAETPRRAFHCEQQLLGQPLTAATVENACRALSEDFQPLSDFRASAAYRLQLAKNLLRRYHASLSGELILTEVSDYVP
ncbi:xanthine dehydrogenase small subunit [Erwinia persicina]|uniref:xanthine dehydrogenase small subunit n=1 Tax=Erwinia persicina TaxID=55211 RepID=UPI0007870362|nr:xanthine dehydrogenase small subunit [Erwinia persicina]